MAIQGKVEQEGKGIAGQRHKLWLWGVAGIFAGITAGCSTFPGFGVKPESPPEEKQKAVLERANARWKAVQDRNVELSYAFLSSGSKAAYSLAVYGGRARLSGFRSVDVKSAACDAETCKVSVHVVLDHKLMKGIPFDYDENWVLENGQYWYVWRP